MIRVKGSRIKLRSLIVAVEGESSSLTICKTKTEEPRSNARHAPRPRMSGPREGETERGRPSLKGVSMEA